MSRSSPVFAAMTMAAAAMLACSDSLLPLPEDGPPAEMRFSTGGFAASSYRLEVHGDSVLAWLYDWSTPAAVDSARAVPTPAQWTAFWEAARESGVPRWRRYVQEGVVDGGGFSLRIEHDGRVLEASGSNAWPDERGREHHEPTEAYQRFREALDQLVGRPLTAPD